MSILISNVKMPLDAAFSTLSERTAALVSVPLNAVRAVRVLRQSLDARKKNDICWNLHIVAQLAPEWQNKALKRGLPNVAPYAPPVPYTLPPCAVGAGGRILVAGLGPGGLFAAYYLAKFGYKPLVVERGKPTEERVADVERFWNGGPLLEQSNVMFGEGGAGTFSDGKLTARTKDPRADEALSTLVAFGAPADAAYLGKPHVGTDRLRAVVAAMRREILRLGGEVRFETTLVGLEESGGRLSAVHLERAGRREREKVDTLILATGQGARDTYEMLLHRGVALAPKAFAVGVRVEHPQGMIDKAQYGPFAGHPALGAAEYRLTAQWKNRGVYTFCMCPGGLVVASSSGAGEVVVNGMSYRARDGENANAAVIVQVGPTDFGEGPLDGIRFQQRLEQSAFRLGGGDYRAPAQRMEDFRLDRPTRVFGAVTPSYRPGVTGAALSCALPLFVAEGIRSGIAEFARQLKGFDLPDAVLTGVESRTSAPVRILRDESGQSISLRGLYPVGEGAGYAGGIVSAAVDGMRAAERAAQWCNQGKTATK